MDPNNINENSKQERELLNLNEYETYTDASEATKKGNGEQHYLDDECTAGDTRCGIGPFKPECLQTFAGIKSFIVLYSTCGLMTQVLSMYIVSQITSIEKQFGLSSAQSGFLMSCNDLGFVLFSLLSSYMARKVHIPRTLWLSAVVFGLGGIVCSLAYFISKDYTIAQANSLSEMLHRSDNRSSSNLLNDLTIHSNNTLSSMGASMTSFTRKPLLCMKKVGDYRTSYITNVSSNHSMCDYENEAMFDIGVPNKYTTMAIVIIAIGMILQGIAKSPRFPCTTCYVDDNVDKKDTAMYMGIMTGVMVFGPVIAFILGGVFSRRYVTLQDMPISMGHPAWIGAWWVGFVIFGLMSIVTSFPLLWFPRRLNRQRYVHSPAKDKKQSTFKYFIKDFAKSLFRLVSNGTYMPLNMSAAFKLLGTIGMVAFIPKYMETQFSIPAWKANIIIGSVQIMAACVGTIAGGIIVTKRKLSPLGCIKMVLIVVIAFSVIICLGSLFGCDAAEIVGFDHHSRMLDNNATCSTTCGCQERAYFPVCGSDNITYMTPCHAGCAHQDAMTFKACSCIGVNATATAGFCESTCKMLFPYVIVTGIGGLGSMGTMPFFIASIRSVSEQDKAMAVGLNTLLNTIIGWFAGPIIMGKIIDTACVKWHTSCDGQGACALYDNKSFRLRFHLGVLIPVACSIGFVIIALLKARKKTDWSIGTNDDKTVEVGRILLDNKSVDDQANIDQIEKKGHGSGL